MIAGDYSDGYWFIHPACIFHFCAIALCLSAASLTGTGICRAHRHGSLGHFHAHHPRGRIGAGIPETAGLSARHLPGGNGQPHPVLTAGMGSFWLLGWLL